MGTRLVRQRSRSRNNPNADGLPPTERPSIPLAELISREVGMDNDRGPEN
jgi:hypothetical protein